MATPGFSFANPKPSPDDYNEFDPQDVAADSSVAELPVDRSIPAPWKTPPVMSLSDVIGANASQQIQAAGKIVFHSVGDTGGVKEPSHQFAVADAMSDDIGTETLRKRPACFFLASRGRGLLLRAGTLLLRPILRSLSGLCRADLRDTWKSRWRVFKSEPVAFSLAAFYENFCTKAPTNDPSAKGFARTTMTQPGVYFTLNAPFLKIIGLYSNTGESTGIISDATTGTAQLQFLQSQLAAAAAQRAQKGAAPFALVLAVHHPPFTISSSHFPSPAMLAQIDAGVRRRKIWPDIVLSGHAHLYERYTRTMKADGRQIPYVVAGNGGYLNLSGPRQGKNGLNPQPGIPGNDGKGNQLTLNVYNNTTHGFLRLTVDKDSILCESLGVNETTDKTSSMDAFTVDLTKHVVATTRRNTSQQNPDR